MLLMLDTFDHSFTLFSTFRKLYAAEQRERELEQRLSEMALRVKDITKHLSQFQQVVQEEMLAVDATEAGAALSDGLGGTDNSKLDANLSTIDRTEADAAATEEA
jgi:hypothetical protein